MTDLELQRLRTEVALEHASAETPRLHPLSALSSLAGVMMLCFVLLTALIGGFVSYAVFQTRTNDRLDAIEAHQGKQDASLERIEGMVSHLRR